MNVAPEATFEAVIDTGTIGLVGTIGLAANDNTGTLAIAFSSTGITELAPGVYAATGRTAPDTEGQYTLIWREGASGDVLGIEDLTVTYSAPGELVPGTPVTPWATEEELARILQLTPPTAEQTVALTRVLTSAAESISDYLDRTTAFTDPPPARVVQANLELAEIHWKHEQSPLGFVMSGDTVAYATRDYFRRHARMLLPLKQQWGVG